MFRTMFIVLFYRFLIHSRFCLNQYVLEHRFRKHNGVARNTAQRMTHWNRYKWSSGSTGLFFLRLEARRIYQAEIFYTLSKQDDTANGIDHTLWRDSSSQKRRYWRQWSHAFKLLRQFASSCQAGRPLGTPAV